jgi:hypothetical protein
MFYRDYNPPHFHAVYGDYEGLIDINKKELISGKLPPRVLGLVIEWAALHQAELLENWERANRQEQLLNIEPLV